MSIFYYCLIYAFWSIFIFMHFVYEDRTFCVLFIFNLFIWGAQIFVNNDLQYSHEKSEENTILGSTKQRGKISRFNTPSSVGEFMCQLFLISKSFCMQVTTVLGLACVLVWSSSEQRHFIFCIFCFEGALGLKHYLIFSTEKWSKC